MPLGIPLAGPVTAPTTPAATDRSPGPWRDGYRTTTPVAPAAAPTYDEQQAALTPPDASTQERQAELGALRGTLREARNLKTLAESGAETAELQVAQGREGSGERLVPIYRRVSRGLETLLLRGESLLREVSDAQGQPKAEIHPLYISSHHGRLRAQLVELKADLEATPAYMQGVLGVHQAEDNIVAAQQVREVAKKGATAVATLAGGEVAGELVGTALDIADEVIGQRLIEKGQSTSLEQLSAIAEAKAAQRIIDFGAKQLADKLPKGHPLLKDIAKHYGIETLAGFAKDVLEFAMVKGPHGPTRHPSLEDLERAVRLAFMKLKQRLQARAKAEAKAALGTWDFADQDLAEYAAGRAFEVIDLVIETERAQPK